jgi:Flp pilus assembly protein TadG
MLRTRRSRRGRRGSALIEFMLLLPFWATALFGALEFGQIFQERLELTNAAREGIRHIAVGDTTTLALAAMQNSQPQLGITSGQVTFETSSDGTTWTAIADSGSNNTAPRDNLCRVTVTDWPHRMVTGAFFQWLPGVSGGVLLVHAQEVMVRQ